MKRIVLVLALAASALLGSVVTTTASTPTVESTMRANLSNCVLVDEAVKIGVSLTTIPTTAWNCRVFRLHLRLGR